MSLADLGLIGNCQIAAHVHRGGDVVWCCLPRFDSPPVFGALLDERAGGRFSIGPADGRLGTQRYLPNTNVLETRFETPEGAFRVIDYAPRFIQHGRTFRPTKLIRTLEPLSGTPRVRVECDPVLGWSKTRPTRDQGSHHVTFHGYESELRLTTNAPLAYLNGAPFALTGTRHFVLAWGAPVEEALEPLCDRFLAETCRYWTTWVKHCDVPTTYQEEVIRSALALKLHCYEDTGAIVASLTTSIPEAPGSGRTWDYRYCWLRDSFYALAAFRHLGHFEEREQFLGYLLNIVANSPELTLAPLYRIDGRSDLSEEILPGWPGYLGEGPVRIGNGAATHIQNDVFGELVLALAPLFLDARFREQASPEVLELLIRLARRAVSLSGQPDASIWEYRTEGRARTFSTLMCWAAADRVAQVAATHRPSVAAEFTAAAAKIRGEILSRATSPTHGGLVADYGGVEVDAALLQAVTLRFFGPGDPRALVTIDAVRRDLEHHGWLKRYRSDDGFGPPKVAFTLCTFWLVEALARVGREEEARKLLERVGELKAPLGLYAEDVEPTTGVMWGNYPQAYSHVGLITAAFAAAPRWSEFGP
ncbi:MAG: hypothetical protein K1X89_01195 [Myxococcaceae bacterium]|nr:hypothetical protein [Myxococcaceae bacterium]